MITHSSKKKPTLTDFLIYFTIHSNLYRCFSKRFFLRLFVIFQVVVVVRKDTKCKATCFRSWQTQSHFDLTHHQCSHFVECRLENKSPTSLLDSWTTSSGSREDFHTINGGFAKCINGRARPSLLNLEEVGDKKSALSLPEKTYIENGRVKDLWYEIWGLKCSRRIK